MTVMEAPTSFPCPREGRARGELEREIERGMSWEMYLGKAPGCHRASSPLPLQRRTSRYQTPSESPVREKFLVEERDREGRRLICLHRKRTRACTPADNDDGLDCDERPASPLPSEMQAMRQYMRDSSIEVVVLVEGIEPLTSCTVQARHSCRFRLPSSFPVSSCSSLTSGFHYLRSLPLQTEPKTSSLTIASLSVSP